MTPDWTTWISAIVVAGAIFFAGFIVGLICQNKVDEWDLADEEDSPSERHYHGDKYGC